MLDRLEHLRTDPLIIRKFLQDPTARFLVCAGDEVLLWPAASAIAPLLLGAEALAGLGVQICDPVFLGLNGQAPQFAVDLGPLPPNVRSALEGHGRFVTLGAIQDPVEDETWSVLAQARALLGWNERTVRCAKCGSPTESQNAGYLRTCSDPACGALHFPRTDPVVIVRVTHEDRCLLARQPSFRPGLRSILAGFVEPGESLEAAVVREVREEVGLQLREVTYVGSQPWPFPMNLMVGFTAESQGTEIRVDGSELESAAWTTRDQVRRELAAGSLVLPSVKSIARRLIDQWLG